jgi:23S rRNA (adenine2503-C2)-methyltransferase
MPKNWQRFCKHLPCKVNIIEYNPISFAAYINAGEDKVEAFADHLRKHGVTPTCAAAAVKILMPPADNLAIKEGK